MFEVGKMRLTCPNCDAQYEVPDDVIPAEGRDVQCSNCGNTWFQASAQMENAQTQDAVAHTAAPPNIEPDTPSETSLEAGNASDNPHTAEDGLRNPAPGPEAEMDTSPEPQMRRKLDPEVANVLREEAEHEARVRAREQQSLESQPDLGLEEPASASEADLRAQQARERMARMRGEDPSASNEPSGSHMAAVGAGVAATAAATTAASNSRREMLPDIEEINSTLRSSSEPRHQNNTTSNIPAAPERARRGGFRRGFLWILLLFVLALLVYIYAEKIVAMVPQAEGPLGIYVATIDAARSWLDAKVLNLLGALDGMASTPNTPPSTPADNGN